MPGSSGKDLEALERQKLVGGLDRLGLGGDQRCEPAGRDATEGKVTLRPDPLDQGIDHAGIAIDQARLHRRDRVARDDLARSCQLDARQLGRVLVQRLARDLDAGRDHAPEVLALGLTTSHVVAVAEVDDDAGGLEVFVGGNRIDDAVRADSRGFS